MAAAQGEKGAEAEKPERGRILALLGKHALDALGRPADFREVQVRALWGRQYRVNVLIGKDAASAKIANSFLVVVDDAGKVLDVLTRPWTARYNLLSPPWTASTSPAGGHHVISKRSFAVRAA